MEVVDIVVVGVVNGVIGAVVVGGGKEGRVEGGRCFYHGQHRSYVCPIAFRNFYKVNSQVVKGTTCFPYPVVCLFSA